jgi:putative ABC transport system permease protein
MMFARVLWRLLRGNSGRLSVALVALISGSAVISALLNLQLDVERRLAQEFRTLGANLVIAPASGGQFADSGGAAATLMDERDAVNAIAMLNRNDIVAAEPFLYLVARAGETQVVVAGTRLSELQKLEPSWKITGDWEKSGDDSDHCLVGQAVAREFHLVQGGELGLNYLGRAAKLRVMGIVESGSEQDSQVFVELSAAQSLAGTPHQIGLVQLSVNSAPEAMARIEAQLRAALPGAEVMPIRQVTDAEVRLLGRIRLLIASMVILILVLTALCVLATMAALAMERREDVGLMKALGGPISRIVALFLAEVSVLGAVGGFIGCLAGIALSIWMGRRVFGAAISPRWEILPLTVALMVAVALAGALPLRLLGRVKPAAILRGE